MNVEHLEVFAGETRLVTLHARDSSNAAKNLSGCTLSWRVGRPPNNIDLRTAVFSKSQTVISAPPNGVFSFTVNPEDTENRCGDYEHQGWCTDGSGNVTLVTKGRFRIRSAVAL